jgi:hypothetical protein
VLKIVPSRVDLPEGLTQWEWYRLVSAVAAQWSYPQVSCSLAEIEVLPPESVRRLDDDNINVVVFRGTVWCHNEICGRLTTYPSNAVGMTTTYPLGATGAEISGADVELNGIGSRFHWDGKRSPGDSAIVSLEAVVSHEIGHVLGLRDVCQVDAWSGRISKGCTEAEKDSVMFAPSELTIPTLTDIADLCKIHTRERIEGMTGQDIRASASGFEGQPLTWGLVVLGVAFGGVCVWNMMKAKT